MNFIITNKEYFYSEFFLIIISKIEPFFKVNVIIDRKREGIKKIPNNNEPIIKLVKELSSFIKYLKKKLLVLVNLLTIV